MAQRIEQRVRAAMHLSGASNAGIGLAKAAAEAARAGVASVGKRLKLARRQLSYARLLAPVAGAGPPITR